MWKIFLVFSWPSHLKEDGMGMWEQGWVRTSSEPSWAVMLRTWSSPSTSIQSVRPFPPSHPPPLYVPRGSGIPRNNLGTKVTPQPWCSWCQPAKSIVLTSWRVLSEPSGEALRLWDQGSPGCGPDIQNSFPVHLHSSWVTSWLGLPKALPVLAPKVSCPRKSLTPRQIRTVGHFTQESTWDVISNFGSLRTFLFLP